MGIARSCALGMCATLVAFGAAAQSTPTPTSVATTYAAAIRAHYMPLSTVMSRPASLPDRLKRRVSVHLDRVPLQHVLVEIATQARLGLSYGEEVANSNGVVTLSVKDVTAADALAMAVRGTSWIAMVTAAGQVMVVHAPAPESASQGMVLGHVSDAKTGERITAAEVFLERTRWRTTTDSLGRYRLAEVDSGTYTLTVRRLGYMKQSRKVTVRPEQDDTVDMTLEAAAVALNELVTTATGQQRRRDLGNAITTIKADSVMRSAPVRNLTDLLENRVPGLTVQHTSGAPGDPARLRLRGIGSAFKSNDPVVVVDGVRIYAVQSDVRSGNLTNLDPGTRGGLSNGTAQERRVYSTDVPAPSPLDQIDPNIIEKIEVFKGPSAATLYGADAANGVIVITTKRGKPGPTRWDAHIAQGWTSSPGRYPTGYYRWGHDIFNGIPRFCILTDLTCQLDSLVQFQALNEPALTVLGRGKRTALSLAASGGSQALTYRITGSYENETGLLTLPGIEIDRFREVFNRGAPAWMRRPHQLEKWSVASNVTARLGPSADVMLTTNLSRSEQQRTSLEQQLGSLSGTYIDTVNAVYYRPAFGSFYSGYTLNATSTVLQDYYVRQTASAITFTTGLNASWQPSSWFNARGQAGLDVTPRADNLLLPSGLVAATDSGAVVRGTGRSLVSTFNVQGTVRRRLGLGFVFATNLGANLTSTTTNDLVSSASGLLPGTSAITGAQRIAATERASNASVYGWYIEPGISGERLSLSTGLRLDGGSAYGVRLTRTGGSGFLGNLLGLPKLNASWVISEEPWFPFQALFASLRLRGAYGQSQVQPGPTDRLRLYSGSVSDGGAQLALTNLGNSGLRPERATEFEGGFEADVLDNRVSVELTAYRKMQVDALMPVELPGSVHGGATVLMNIGNIRNRGIDLDFRVTPLQSSEITWSTQLSYSRSSNVLTKLGNGVAPNKMEGLVEGYPVYGRWARPIIAYVDQNGDGALQPQEVQVGDSLVYMGRLLPGNHMSLFTNVMLFGGAVRASAGFSYNSGAIQIDQTARTNWVLARALVDPAAPLGEQAAVLASTRRVEPTDYGLMQEVSTFRFNSLSVDYAVPARIARLLHAQQVVVGIQGSNLALHSTYQGKDPDVNAWSPGEAIVDNGQLPVPRTWQLTMSLQF